MLKKKLYQQFVKPRVFSNGNSFLLSRCISEHFYESTVQNMPEYEFCLICIFPYKDRAYDSAFIRENTGQRKPVFLHILRSETQHTFSKLTIETLEQDVKCVQN